MKTLHLNLHKKWFDMTLSGEKKEDYRDISLYWARILCKDFTPQGIPIFKEFDTTTLSNGYKKDRPQFIVQHKEIVIGTGKPEWGAVEGKNCFIIRHGGILCTQNILTTL